MKVVFAYIARDSVAMVVDLLRMQKLRCLSVVELRAQLWPMAAKERFHLPELAGGSVADAKLEIVCDDDVLPGVIEAVSGVVNHGGLGTGGVFVAEVTAVPIAASAVLPTATTPAGGSR
jgi:nitrogen regulatory protein PII